MSDTNANNPAGNIHSILRNEALHIIEAIDKLDLIKLDIHMCKLLKWWEIQKEIEKEFSGT